MSLMRQVRQILMVMLTALLAGCVAQPSQHPVAWQPLSPLTRSVTTTGSSSVYVKPDVAIVRFSVDSRDADLVKAKSANVAASRAALQTLRSLQIEDKEVQAQLTRSERDYEKMADGHMRFVGYVVTRKYAVKLHDLDRFEPVIEALLARPEYTDQQYTFDTADRDKLLERAKQQAIRNARLQAQSLAAELGCEIGAPSQINESSSEYRTGGGNLFGGSDDSDTASVTPLGEIEVKATVSVSFDLVPKK